MNGKYEQDFFYRYPFRYLD